MTSVRPMVTGGNRKQSGEIIPKIPEDRHCCCENVSRFGDGCKPLYVKPEEDSDFFRKNVQNIEKESVFETNIKFSYVVLFLTLNFEFPPHFIPPVSSPFAFSWRTENPFFWIRLFQSGEQIQSLNSVMLRPHQ